MAHKTLLKDTQVRRWYDNVSRASELTAEVNLRRLGLFCNRLHLTPLGLLEKQPQEIHSLLVDTLTELEKKGYAGSYLQGIVKGVKSWLSFNDVSLGERKINFTDPDDTPTLREEKAPWGNLPAGSWLANGVAMHVLETLKIIAQVTALVSPVTVFLGVFFWFTFEA